MDNEKSRQMASIADKIAEKKRKRALALAKRHDADNKKELAEDRKERNELMDQQVRKLLMFFLSLLHTI